ncbi:uncharacterized protein CLUP02_04630 [Colletotrichum lupini]|uniref:Uncharacterized protein n=1 Tax=Colletotrichum lupini TaxID=145971 RepID=A0A9Q8SLQ0_9PEZI|nr:uncharacterized protein CLUP02_04630 [Colletotrichum lupini]UQC79151.1 hypothetical protein CLUP02_04630 [Colletotrichum lupini]
MSESVYLDKGGHGIPDREEDRGFTAVQGGVLVGCRRLTIATACRGYSSPVPPQRGELRQMDDHVKVLGWIWFHLRYTENYSAGIFRILGCGEWGLRKNTSVAQQDVHVGDNESGIANSTLLGLRDLVNIGPRPSLPRCHDRADMAVSGSFLSMLHTGNMKEACRRGSQDSGCVGLQVLDRSVVEWCPCMSSWIHAGWNFDSWNQIEMTLILRIEKTGSVIIAPVLPGENWATVCLCLYAEETILVLAEEIQNDCTEGHRIYELSSMRVLELAQEEMTTCMPYGRTVGPLFSHVSSNFEFLPVFKRYSLMGHQTGLSIRLEKIDMGIGHVAAGRPSPGALICVTLVRTILAGTAGLLNLPGKRWPAQRETSAAWVLRPVITAVPKISSTQMVPIQIEIRSLPSPTQMRETDWNSRCAYRAGTTPTARETKQDVLWIIVQRRTPNAANVWAEPLPRVLLLETTQSKNKLAEYLDPVAIELSTVAGAGEHSFHSENISVTKQVTDFWTL